jgi:hypothetical protein|tara:strand:- start:671 stop:871 length:201 start_codon:yes stop_codon:yes gene_type:complete
MIVKRKFTREDLNVDSINFKGVNYKVDKSQSRKEKGINGNLFRLFLLNNGLCYAYSKISKMVHTTY